jgi:hypothetical protein
MNLPRRVDFPEISQRETNMPFSGTAIFRDAPAPFASERRRIPHTGNTCSLPVLRPFVPTKTQKPEHRFPGPGSHESRCSAAVFTAVSI